MTEHERRSCRLPMAACSEIQRGEQHMGLLLPDSFCGKRQDTWKGLTAQPPFEPSPVPQFLHRHVSSGRSTRQQRPQEFETSVTAGGFGLCRELRVPELFRREA